MRISPALIMAPAPAAEEEAQAGTKSTAQKEQQGNSGGVSKTGEEEQWCHCVVRKNQQEGVDLEKKKHE